MHNFEGSNSFTSFKELSGISVREEDVIYEISKMPLDGILGFLAGLSLEMIQDEDNFFSPRLQGGYLQNALVDDFPKKIPWAFKMYSPGRVPITGGRHIFIHEQNLAWLCNAAVLNSKENQTTPKISFDLRCRLFRILLIINDFLSVGNTAKPFDLNKRRNLSLNWLRHGQFNRLFGGLDEILVKLARQKILLLDILPKYYTGIESDFNDATGVSLSAYFYAICLFVTHIYKGMKRGNHWLSENTFTSNIKNNVKDIKKVISDWKRNPSQYREAYNLWMEDCQDDKKFPIYDFVPLRETPLIEGRPFQLICPLPSFLFSKIEDGPFYILSDFLNHPKLGEFHSALGKAYEEYAHQLVEGIAYSDIRGIWNIERNPQVEKIGELADSYLQRNNIAIVFEHKGQRPGSKFLRGKQTDRVLGPTENILERIENGETIDYGEGKKYDKGFITRGMWQQSKKGSDIIKWANNKFGEKPIYIYPVITLLSSLVIDIIIRKAYLNPLINKTKLYIEAFWQRPQWINIADLESLAQIAKDGKLDFEDLLSEKVENAVDGRFDMFLSSKKLKTINIRLHAEVIEILNKSCIYFYGEKIS